MFNTLSLIQEECNGGLIGGDRMTLNFPSPFFTLTSKESPLYIATSILMAFRAFSHQGEIEKVKVFTNFCLINNI